MRLGEHDTNIKHDDGQHIDVGIARFETHKDYSNYLVFHTFDITIVHLVEDVKFTGKLKYWIRRIKVGIYSRYIPFASYLIIDRIRPICLPIDEDARNLNIVDTNPYVEII